MPSDHGTGAGFLAGVRYSSLLSNAHNVQQHIQPPSQIMSKWSFSLQAFCSVT